MANEGFARVNTNLSYFHSHDRNKQIKLFNTFVRPILEYASPVCSSHLRHDITVIERVQEHVKKCLRDLHKKSYAERLAILN